MKLFKALLVSGVSASFVSGAYYSHWRYNENAKNNRPQLTIYAPKKLIPNQLRMRFLEQAHALVKVVDVSTNNPELDLRWATSSQIEGLIKERSITPLPGISNLAEKSIAPDFISRRWTNYLVPILWGLQKENSKQKEIFWVGGFVVDGKSKHPELARKWIEFMLQPESATLLSLASGYASTNQNIKAGLLKPEMMAVKLRQYPLSSYTAPGYEINPVASTEGSTDEL